MDKFMDFISIDNDQAVNMLLLRRRRKTMNKRKQYEKAKIEIIKQSTSPGEYEKKVKELARKMKI